MPTGVCDLLERRFRLAEHGTTVRVELRAGVTTFLTMAYIVVVNPSMLAEAGVPFEGALFATCVAAAVASLTMGLIANYPFALAPGMGLNAYFAYTVVLGSGVPWQTALGAVFLSGVLFFLLTVTRVRALVLDAIPLPLRFGTAAGIGLLIAFVGFRNAGLVVSSPATLVTMGEIGSTGPLLSLGGLAFTAALMARRVRGAILLGILATAAAAVPLGLARLPERLVSMPDPASTLLALDLRGALALGLLEVVFVFLFMDLFDTIGSLMGLAQQGGYVREDGSIPRVNRALLSDAMGTMAGALLGTSTVTTYIESAAGIGEGGRTGLVTVMVAALFLLATFAAPMAGAIPPLATAPALIVVGVLMMGAVRSVHWDDATEAVPAFVTMLGMPLTFSIANGLALGFITYPVVKLLTGRGSAVSWLVYVLAGLFVLRYLYLGAA